MAENKQPMADQAADQNPGAVPATDQGAQSTHQGSQAAPDGGGQPFYQEDINNIVARKVKKAQEKMLKQLGIEDFQSAKEGLQKFREWQDAQKTEAEKQAERLKELE